MILFARPRHDYASYQDLYRLIDLSGFPSVYIDEIDTASDNTYILTILNGEVPADGYPASRAKLVLFDLEYHLDGIHLPGVEVWAADKWYAEQIGAKYVPMGSHAGLADNVAFPEPSSCYDVAFIGYINGIHRREVIRQQLIERGVRVSPTGAWGEARHRVLANSRAYLHVHQHDHVPTIAPLRMVVAAAYSLPVISETVADAGMFAHLMFRFDYTALVQGVATTIDFATLADAGSNLYYILCDKLTFRKSIEAAL